jgi:hypothetical protein
MLPGLKTIVFSALLLPPMFFFQTAPQPGLLKVTSNPPGANVTINTVDNNNKPVEGKTNVTLVVTPGQYKVTAKSGSKILNCTPTPATVHPGQTTGVICN